MSDVVAKTKGFCKLTEGQTVVVFDTETTGFRASDDVVQFSGIKCRMANNKLTVLEGKDSILSIYIKARKPMPKDASAVNGITDELLAKKGLDNREAATLVYRFLHGHPIIGQNIPFDVRMVNGWFNHLKGNETQFVTLYNPPLVADTLPLARLKVKGKKGDKSHNLGNLAALAGVTVPEGLNFHNSLADVYATIGVWNWLIDQFDEDFKDIAETSREELKIYSGSLWEKYGKRRIYFKTNMEGKIFYDLVNQCYVPNLSGKTRLQADQIVKTIIG